MHSDKSKGFHNPSAGKSISPRAERIPWGCAPRQGSPLAAPLLLVTPRGQEARGGFSSAALEALASGLSRAASLLTLPFSSRSVLCKLQELPGEAARQTTRCSQLLFIYGAIEHRETV